MRRSVRTVLRHLSAQFARSRCSSLALGRSLATFGRSTFRVKAGHLRRSLADLPVGDRSGAIMRGRDSRGPKQRVRFTRRMLGAFADGDAVLALGGLDQRIEFRDGTERWGTRGVRWHGFNSSRIGETGPLWSRSLRRWISPKGRSADKGVAVTATVTKWSERSPPWHELAEDHGQPVYRARVRPVLVEQQLPPGEPGRLERAPSSHARALGHGYAKVRRFDRGRRRTR
jgi:hypothetical protein